MTGITLNPFSPLGGSFDAHEFLVAAREAFAHYGVSDVMLEEDGIFPLPSQQRQALIQIEQKEKYVPFATRSGAD